MTADSPRTYNKQNTFLIVMGSAFLAILGTLGVLAMAGWLSLPQSNRQAAVHDMGSQVMPFDLGQTTHIFEMTESGGVQQVIADDPSDSAQVALIQQHLQHESMLFSSGDFSDPFSLHGVDMPGVNELAAGVDKINIEYAAVSDGAQITFTTQDIRLITAIHRWFGAQLSDHGADAASR